MLTNITHFDTTLYLQPGARNGEVALYTRSNYPGSEPKLIGTFSHDKQEKVIFVLAEKGAVKVMTSAPPVEVKVADDIPF